MIRLLAIDPGSRKIGLAVFEFGRRQYLRCVGLWTVKLTGDKAARLFAVHELISKTIDEYLIDAVAIESGFVGRNPKTSLVIGEARGAAISAVPWPGRLIEVDPSTAKLIAAGSGKADKLQVRRAIKSRLGLSELPEEDAADAAAVGLAAMDEARRILTSEKAVVSSGRGPGRKESLNPRRNHSLKAGSTPRH